MLSLGQLKYLRVRRSRARRYAYNWLARRTDAPREWEDRLNTFVRHGIRGRRSHGHVPRGLLAMPLWAGLWERALRLRCACESDMSRSRCRAFKPYQCSL